MIKLAITYLRSSKDRSAVSLAAQRRELLTLAKSKNLVVSHEYTDAVESGKDIDRPGFQALLRDLKDKKRSWSAVLMYDTSRLGRRRYIAEAFRHECKKFGVEIHFAKVPDVDPISKVILDSVLQAMDEVHSLMSREKGLAGMAENVRQGFRAGGRAPYGYKLVTIETGQVRDGTPVTKSRLEPDENAPKIASWLRGRIAGKNGAALANELGIDLAKSTLTHIEWSALTYAGHTVWNVHHAKEDRAQGRRRAREDWIIQKNTHPAIITESEAESLLKKREVNKAQRATRSRASDYLLSGILVTQEGTAWWGNSGNYRAGKTNIRAEIIEQALLDQVARDIRTDEFITLLTEKARIAQQPTDGFELDDLAKQIKAIDVKIGRVMSAIEQTDTPAPLLRRVSELEMEREELIGRLERLKEATSQAKALAAVSESDVRRMLNVLAEDISTLDRQHLKDFLKGIIESLILDPVTRAGEIRYRIKSGVKVASPRGTVLNPTLTGSMPFEVRKRKAA